MPQQRIVSWFSCGAASAVATKLITKKTKFPLEIVYCETGSEHPDNERFFVECQEWFGQPIRRLKSTNFSDTWDVWQRKRYLSGINGAPCTRELKLVPRLEFQHPSDIHIFGYTADAADAKRADVFMTNFPELRVVTPLIRRKITKEACVDLIRRAGIRPPVMYSLGFHNNNCIPCVKAQSPAYWALVRKEFPQEFARMAKLAREHNVRLCKMDYERIFIDQIPLDYPTTNPIQPSCDFMCQMVEEELAGSGDEFVYGGK